MGEFKLRKRIIKVKSLKDYETAPDGDEILIFQEPEKPVTERRRFAEAAGWEAEPHNIADLAARAEARGWDWKISFDHVILSLSAPFKLPYRTGARFELSTIFTSPQISLETLKHISVGIEQKEDSTSFLYDFYASIYSYTGKWTVSPLPEHRYSQYLIPDDIRQPNFEKLFAEAPDLIRSATKYPRIFSDAGAARGEIGKLKRELRQAAKAAPHVSGLAPLAREMFNFILDGPAPPPEEEMHTMSGWNESVDPEDVIADDVRLFHRLFVAPRRFPEE